MTLIIKLLIFMLFSLSFCAWSWILQGCLGNTTSSRSSSVCQLVVARIHWITGISRLRWLRDRTSLLFTPIGLLEADGPDLRKFSLAPF